MFLRLHITFHLHLTGDSSNYNDTNLSIILTLIDSSRLYAKSGKNFVFSLRPIYKLRLSARFYVRICQEENHACSLESTIQAQLNLKISPT